MNIPGISEKINPVTLEEGYQRVSRTEDGKFILIADAMSTQGSPFLRVTAIDQDLNTVGVAKFVPVRGKLLITDSLMAHNVQVSPEHRQLGIATSMYKFVSELGNSIRPSPAATQTDLGKAMVNGMKRHGLRM